jgi:hypothetical protein
MICGIPPYARYVSTKGRLDNNSGKKLLLQSVSGRVYCRGHRDILYYTRILL